MMHCFKFSQLLLALVLVSTAVGDEQPAKPERIALWPDQAPTADGSSAAENAYITIHHPIKPNGTTAIICPGGGYGGLVKGPEGHGIAKWLNQHGITGVVLEYRLPRGRALVPLLDAQRAIRVTRSNASDWNCDPKRIGIIGFSAGGHLASTAATHFEKGDPAAADPIEQASSRPDFAILVYPVISMGDKGHRGSTKNLLGNSPSPELLEQFSTEKQISEQTPPTFLAHAKDDRVVPPENSLRFHEALKEHKVATEYLELPSGGHGLNGYKGPNWDAWQSASLTWLGAQQLLPKPDKP